MAGRTGARRRVLGIDPGTRVTGWGVVEGAGPRLWCLGAGTVRASERLPLEARLVLLYEGLREVVAAHAPEAVAVEDLHARHARAALALGHARGVVLLVAAQAGLPVAPYPPALVRRAVVGRGSADKGQVARLVGAILGLRELPALDATDALALAIADLRRAQVPGLEAAR